MASHLALDHRRVAGRFSVFPRSDGRAVAFDHQTKKSLVLAPQLATALVSPAAGATPAETARARVVSLLDTQLNSASRSRLDLLTDRFTLKLPLWFPDAFLSAHPRVVRFLAGMVFLPALTLATYVVGWRSPQVLEVFRGVDYTDTPVFLVAGIVLVSTVLHEAGHAVVAKRFGANIAEVGAALYLFLPCGYTTICGQSLITGVSRRILIALGGVSVNLTLACSAFLVLPFVDGTVLLVAQWVLLTNFMLFLVNQVVFLNLDGSHVLGAFLGPEYKSRAVRYVAGCLRGHRPAGYDALERVDAWLLCLMSAAFMGVLVITLFTL